MLSRVCVWGGGVRAVCVLSVCVCIVCGGWWGGEIH